MYSDGMGYIGDHLCKVNVSYTIFLKFLCVVSCQINPLHMQKPMVLCLLCVKRL